jgi:antitoxin PrlF
MKAIITSRGQVTLPKSVRDAAGLKPGDKVEVRATASGGIYVEKVGTQPTYDDAKLRALAQRRPIRDITTDEIIEMLRGESESFEPKKG